MIFIYTQEFYGIENVKMEYYDNKMRWYCIEMQYQKAERCWSCTCEQEIHMYKYVVNDIIRLNDPNATGYVFDQKYEVWSVCDKSKAIVPKLSEYGISSDKGKSISRVDKKASYIYDKPLDIYVGIKTQSVIGLHSLTYICFQPDGRIYKIEECAIGKNDVMEEYEVIFQNHIAHIPGRVAEGMWAFQVYLDGHCIIKDYFVLKRKVLSNMALLNYKM